MKVAAGWQVLSMIMLVFSPVMLFIMLPFATTGFIVVVFVIYCGYGRFPRGGIDHLPRLH